MPSAIVEVIGSISITKEKQQAHRKPAHSSPTEHNSPFFSSLTCIGFVLDCTCCNLTDPTEATPKANERWGAWPDKPSSALWRSVAAKLTKVTRGPRPGVRLFTSFSSFSNGSVRFRFTKPGRRTRGYLFWSLCQPCTGTAGGLPSPHGSFKQKERLAVGWQSWWQSLPQSWLCGFAFCAETVGAPGTRWGPFPQPS